MSELKNLPYIYYIFIPYIILLY